MIINTGARTDIPAFYSKWFLKRIEEGYVCVRNPYYPSQVTKYSLDPQVVDCLLFCTKNPQPLLPHLHRLDKYRQYWHVTITPYGKDIEPRVPDYHQVIESFKTLSKHVGIDAIQWRYDPIFIYQEYDVERHIQAFEDMARLLQGYTHQCTISFLDLYEKVKKNAPMLQPPTPLQQIELVKAFVDIGKKYQIEIYTCLENKELQSYGVHIEGCMSQSVIENAIDHKLNPPKHKTAREGCSCLLGHDIGSYNSCGHLCMYCYANANQALVKKQMLQHDIHSPFLIGNFQEGDIIRQAKQTSWLVSHEQLTLF